MDSIKKILGVVWIALGLFAAYYLASHYWKDIGSEKQEDNMKAIVFIFVLIPIITGSLVRFGIFALQGEYSEEK